MIHGITKRLNRLLDHYAAAGLALVLVILTPIGIGDIRVTALLGFLLCGIGITMRSARADLWILASLILYDLASLASSYAAYGSIMDGYGAMHAIFPIIYLLTACLDRMTYAC